jgi:hypothetical protein
MVVERPVQGAPEAPATVARLGLPTYSASWGMPQASGEAVVRLSGARP